MTIAYVRVVPDSINDCQLTYLERVPIDVDRARSQHRAYVDLLGNLGAEVRYLPAAHHSPDSVFVEDTALVLDEIAVITNPGAESRRAEVESVRCVLSAHRRLADIDRTATLDGGDIVVVGRRVFVGVTNRSNRAGAESLASIVKPYGYAVERVEVSGCLHLKSAATAIGGDAVLVSPEHVDPAVFTGLRTVEAHPDEPDGANAVVLGGALIHAAEYPKTTRALTDAGFAVHNVEASELAKAEGAVTCCSLLVGQVDIT